jgi:bud site selection protein 31
MARIRRRSQLKPPPEWECVKETVLGLNVDMRCAESTNVDANSSQEQLWRVMQCNWKRSRFVFEARWRSKTMSDRLSEWILAQGFGDREVINGWRRPGYDRLCCAHCIAKHSDHGRVCLCRVPRSERTTKDRKCFHCECPGCCSGDYAESGSESEDASSAPDRRKS